MTKIFYTSRIKIGNKISVPGATLLDTGSANCYIDTEFAEGLKIHYKNKSRDYVGFGGISRLRYGIFNIKFIVKLKDKIYKGIGKTYITNLPEDFSIVISGNLIRKMKLPIQKIKEISENVEY